MRPVRPHTGGQSQANAKSTPAPALSQDETRRDECECVFLVVLFLISSGFACRTEAGSNVERRRQSESMSKSARGNVDKVKCRQPDSHVVVAIRHNESTARAF